MKGAAALCLCTLLTACAGFDNLGQVQPWEKGDLARPQMALEPDAADARFIQHIYTSKESASGGYGVGGGGCGCN